MSPFSQPSLLFPLSSFFASPAGGAASALFCVFEGGDYVCDCTAPSLPARTANATAVQCVACLSLNAGNLPYVAPPIDPQGGTIDL